MASCHQQKRTHLSVRLLQSDSLLKSFNRRLEFKLSGLALSLGVRNTSGHFVSPRFTSQSLVIAVKFANDACVTAALARVKDERALTGGEILRV